MSKIKADFEIDFERKAATINSIRNFDEAYLNILNVID